MMLVWLVIVGFLTCSPQGGECNWLKEKVAPWIPSIPKIFKHGVDDYIVRGKESPHHMFYYQASLYIEFEETATNCGGSLLTPEWVLTAAHCIQPSLKSPKFSTIYVVLGAHNRDEDEPHQQEFTSREAYIHPGWMDPSRKRMVDDVALIKLDKPAQLNYYVNTVRLPTDDEKELTFENWPVRVAGWGVTETGESSDILRYLDTEIVGPKKCDEELGVTNKVICTSGKERRGVGPGDSGGPLVAYGRDGKPFQIGICSFNHGSGLGTGKPAGFARVTYYLDWIKDTMAKNSPRSLDSSSKSNSNSDSSSSEDDD